MRNKIAALFLVVSTASIYLPLHGYAQTGCTGSYCQVQRCTPDSIEIRLLTSPPIAAPGANQVAMYSSMVYRLKIEEQRETWRNQTSLASTRYFATLPADVFTRMWRTSPEFAKVTNSKQFVDGSSNISYEMFSKAYVSQGIPIRVSFEDSLPEGRSKFLKLTLQKPAIVSPAPTAPPGGFAPTTMINPNANPVEASVEYDLTIPYKVVESCR